MGFEPTTSAVTGRRSNQLSHQAKIITCLLYINLRQMTTIFLKEIILSKLHIKYIHPFDYPLRITLVLVQ